MQTKPSMSRFDLRVVKRSGSLIAVVMQDEPSVHDNFVYGYYVNCEAQRIVLHTAFRDLEPLEYTDLVFRGVLAHHFEHVLRANILFDVEELDVSAFVKQNMNLFGDSWRYGWPPVEYGGDPTSLIKQLTTLSVRVYMILSSCGLSGWILATDCERVSRGEAATIA